MTRGYATLREVEEAWVRPLYARVLRLRHFQPSGMVCFLLLEGSVAAALVLALAELVSWWGLIVLPVAVALLVKANDVVALAVARSAKHVPQRERDRFQREARPAVGRASVQVSPSPGERRSPAGGDASGGADRRGTVYASSARPEQFDHGDGWGWHGRQPEWHGEQSEWHAEQTERRTEQPVRRTEQPVRRTERPGPRDDPPEGNGQSPGWGNEQASWRADQRGWPGAQSGWPPNERGYG